MGLAVAAARTSLAATTHPIAPAPLKHKKVRKGVTTKDTKKNNDPLAS